MNLIENPIIGTTIGAGAMSAPWLNNASAISAIFCAVLGGAASILVMVIHVKKNARGKKKHELEMELIKKKIKHEDTEIGILKSKK